MSFRITTANFDPARRTEFLAFADSQRDKIKAVPGVQSVHTIEVGVGQSIIIARYDSEEGAVAATSTVQEILGGMAEFMTSPPDRKGGPIIWEM